MYKVVIISTRYGRLTEKEENVHYTLSSARTVLIRTYVKTREAEEIWAIDADLWKKHPQRQKKGKCVAEIWSRKRSIERKKDFYVQGYVGTVHRR